VIRRLPALLALTLVLTGVTACGATPSPQPAAGPAAPAGAEPSNADSLTSGDLLPTAAPTRVEIPALGVAAPIIGLGLQPDGAMDVPADARTVGWFTEAPTPGALGPAVLAGHVDFRGAAGTFAKISELGPGDDIRVARADGRTAVFAVTRVEQYAKDAFPADDVYGAIDHAGLRLITCGGDFDRSTQHYVDNIVVYAALRST
jgi:sortase (surface protein transpeptidase)